MATIKQLHRQQSLQPTTTNKKLFKKQISFDETTIKQPPQTKEKQKTIDIFLARNFTNDDVELEPKVETATNAQTKRDLFRRNSKTINVTLNEEIIPVIRPPLIRAQTLPTSNNPPTKKFEKKRSKTARAHHRHESKIVRCKSATTSSEVVTMVSLTSPPLSDAEEEQQQQQLNFQKLQKENLVKKEEIKAKLEAQRLLTLKKIVKQVSFRPIGLPNKPLPPEIRTPIIRNQSANSYFHRRTSLTALSFQNVTNTEPRLVTSSPAPSTSNLEVSEKPRTENLDGVIQVKPIQNGWVTETTIPPDNSWNQSGSLEMKTEAETEPKLEETEQVPNFDNPKETQCWRLYKKMADKGVDISFDTILRGILTPTEYRLRNNLRNKLINN